MKSQGRNGLLCLLLLLGLVGCSGKSSEQSSNESPAGTEVAASNGADTDEILAEADAAQTETATAEENAPVANQTTEAVIPEAAPVEEIKVSSTPEIKEVGGEKEYKVSKNETLMMVSFKVYGDYSRWKEIAKYNRSTLKGTSIVREGMVLKYLSDGSEFNWNPKGTAYLIKTGETLGTISNTVYGTKKKWKSLWDNNRPLIKDPNVIFAGFTIYYINENGKMAMFDPM